ncbi:transposase family protein [Streptosporangium sp. NPDC002524]|uniref:transposase family protein n=1 Tax=Streptosporangium sp. NPDC002524 TaxID=3154537 RepID=UPI00332F911A
MRDVDELVSVVFAGLSPLVVENVADERERIRVRARTPDGPVARPGCGAETARVHGHHERNVADVPVDARRVFVAMRTRRLTCPTRGCRQKRPGRENRQPGDHLHPAGRLLKGSRRRGSGQARIVQERGVSLIRSVTTCAM